MQVRRTQPAESESVAHTLILLPSHLDILLEGAELTVWPQ